MQTGRLGGKAVKGKDKKKAKDVTNRDAAGRLNIVMPLVDSMALWPPFYILMSNHCALAAYKAGEPMYVRKGTKVVEVSETRVLAKRKVLEDG